MRILSHRTTKPTSKSATGHRHQYCRSQIFHRCKMPQAWCPNQLLPWQPPVWLFQCPKATPAQAPFQAQPRTMLPLQLTEPPALAGDCQWPEPHPCRSGPWQLQLHQCKLVHWQPHRTGHLDMGLLQRKHFFKGLPYHAPPGKRLTFQTHWSHWQIIISRWWTPFATWIPMVYSSSASQWRPYIERECQPRLHQTTICRRHRAPYGDQSAMHHCHKSSTGLPATSVQPSWNLNRSHHSYAWREAITRILRSRVLSLTCKGTNKHQVCCPLTATTTHGEGMAQAAPSLHTAWSTLETTAICPYGYPQEFGRPKTEDSRFKTIAHSLYCHIVCICIFVFLFIWIFVSLYHMCSFQGTV